MRKRNILKTIYLNNKENNILQEKTKGTNQSKYIRDLIKYYEPRKINIEIFDKYRDRLLMFEKELKRMMPYLEKYGIIDKYKYRRIIDELNIIIEDIKLNLHK
ncbi:MAG: hypothetical protein IJE04_01485 [Bacilli bacterium]|nr:hypothetical protein [Bacilli bacterium]